MIKVIRISALGWLSLCALGSAAWAAAFEQARVTAVVNKVSVGETAAPGSGRTAKVSDIVRAEQYVLSQAASRAELTFPDQSLVRIGQSTIFTFAEGARVVSLQKGAAMFYMPRGAAPTQFKTPTLTAAITGSAATAYVVYGPNGKLKSEGIGTVTGDVNVEGNPLAPLTMIRRDYDENGNPVDSIVPFNPANGQLYNMGPLPFKVERDGPAGPQMPNFEDFSRNQELFERGVIDPRSKPPEKIEAPKKEEKEIEQDDEPYDGGGYEGYGHSGDYNGYHDLNHFSEF